MTKFDDLKEIYTKNVRARSQKRQWCTKVLKEVEAYVGNHWGKGRFKFDLLEAENDGTFRRDFSVTVESGRVDSPPDNSPKSIVGAHPAEVTVRIFADIASGDNKLDEVVDDEDTAEAMAAQNEPIEEIDTMIKLGVDRDWHIKVVIAHGVVSNDDIHSFSEHLFGIVEGRLDEITRHVKV